MTAPHPEAALSAQKIDHEFKSPPDVFWAAARGEKPFEFRKDDRGGYHVGQTVRLRCYDRGGYAEVAPLDRRITNILRGGEFGLQEGYCVLGLAPLSTVHTATAGDGGERVRHVKRGTEYEVLGEAEAQVSEGMQRYLAEGAARIIYDGHLLTVYRCETTGKLWCRFTDEFRDGRFETISTSPTPTDAQPKAARPVGDEALTRRVHGRTVLEVADLVESRVARGEQPGANFPAEWLPFLVQGLRAALASYPTTGQETVATPREDGVRQALEGLHGAIERLDPTDGIEIPSFSTPDELASALGLGEGLSAPGSAGPGETAPDELTEGEIAGRAKELILSKGWQFGDHMHGMAVLGMMTEFGISLLKAPPQDRCSHPDCGCEADSVCSAALATPSPAQEPGTGDTGAMADIAAERRRQVEAEGWTPEHDDAHEAGQMAGAAACYALADIMHWRKKEAIDQFWPWDNAWWKPGDRRRNLVKSGALIVAEIERLDRATPATTAETRGPAEGAR